MGLLCLEAAKSQYWQCILQFRVGIIRDIIDEARAYYEEPPDDVGLDEEEELEESSEDIVDLY